MVLSSGAAGHIVPPGYRLLNSAFRGRIVHSPRTKSKTAIDPLYKAPNEASIGPRRFNSLLEHNAKLFKEHPYNPQCLVGNTRLNDTQTG